MQNDVILKEAEVPKAQPDEQRPPPDRYDMLTIARGIACLMVVMYHSLFTGYGRPLPDDRSFIFDILHKGWLGVPLFFVISGYCVTASAEALRRRNAPAWSFFWRRFRRIYPPYWVWFGLLAVSVYVVETFVSPGFFEAAMIANPEGFSGWQWVGNLTLTETWRWHWTGGVEKALWWPGWTLCYEEQFYFLVGLSLLLVRRFFFVALGILSIFVGVGLFVGEWNTQGTFLDGKWFMFAAGVLVYFILNRVPENKRPWYCIPLVLGILYAVADPQQLLRPAINEPNQSYLVAFAFALGLVFVRKWDAVVVRSAVLRPLRYCGDMCYSLYLVHWPVVTLVGHAFDSLGVVHPMAILTVTLPCCVGATLVLGRIFHLLVERRFWNPRVVAP